MALGSSAPEILLSIISTAKDIEAIPPEIGPSTIVGSAAFNLLVISGVSIIAVGGEDPEKDDFNEDSSLSRKSNRGRRRGRRRELLGILHDRGRMSRIE